MFAVRRNEDGLFQKYFSETDCVYVLLNRETTVDRNGKETPLKKYIGFFQNKIDSVIGRIDSIEAKDGNFNCEGHEYDECVQVFSSYTLAANAALYSITGAALTADGIPLIGKMSVNELLRCVYNKFLTSKMYAVILDNQYFLSAEDLLISAGYTNDDQNWNYLPDEYVCITFQNPIASLYYGITLQTTPQEWNEVIESAKYLFANGTRVEIVGIMHLVRIYMQSLPAWYLPCSTSEINLENIRLNPEVNPYQKGSGWLLFGDRSKAEDFAERNDMFIAQIKPNQYFNVLNSAKKTIRPPVFALDLDESEEPCLMELIYLM